MKRIGIWLSLVLFLFLPSSCSPLRLADWFGSSPTTDTSKKQTQGVECPVTASENKFSMVGPLAGKSPVWLTSVGEIKWNDLPVSLSPYPGRLTKMLVFVSKDVEGDLEITGKQIDGNSQLLFPQETKTQKISSSEGNSVAGAILVNPQSMWVKANANKPTNFPNPDGFAHHGLLVYYPSPGCYEYVAKISGDEVRIVLNVVDK